MNAAATLSEEILQRFDTTKNESELIEHLFEIGFLRGGQLISSLPYGGAAKTLHGENASLVKANESFVHGDMSFQPCGTVPLKSSKMDSNEAQAEQEVHSRASMTGRDSYRKLYPASSIDAPGTDGARQIAHLQAKLQQRLGPEYIASRTGPAGGAKLHYIEGWKAIDLANEVFGFNGWSSSVLRLDIDYMDELPNGRVNVGVSSIVRITLRDGTYHEDLGYGQCENARTKAQALEKAKKEAVTDATKRALRTFGRLLGNCLYDKRFIETASRMKAEAPKYDVSDLKRAPEAAQDLACSVERRKQQQMASSSGSHQKPVTGTTSLEASSSAEMSADGRRKDVDSAVSQSMCSDATSKERPLRQCKAHSPAIDEVRQSSAKEKEIQLRQKRVAEAQRKQNEMRVRKEQRRGYNEAIDEKTMLHERLKAQKEGNKKKESLSPGKMNFTMPPPQIPLKRSVQEQCSAQLSARDVGEPHPSLRNTPRTHNSQTDRPMTAQMLDGLDDNQMIAALDGFDTVDVELSDPIEEDPPLDGDRNVDDYAVKGERLALEVDLKGGDLDSLLDANNYDDDSGISFGEHVLHLKHASEHIKRMSHLAKASNPTNPPQEFSHVRNMKQCRSESRGRFVESQEDRRSSSPREDRGSMSGRMSPMVSRSDHKSSCSRSSPKTNRTTHRKWSNDHCSPHAQASHHEIQAISPPSMRTNGMERNTSKGKPSNYGYVRSIPLSPRKNDVNTHVGVIQSPTVSEKMRQEKESGPSFNGQEAKRARR